MNTAFNLEVKKPCSEDYNQFQPTEKGGFCSACTKEVIDFTKMNSEEIVSYFKTASSSNTCGRFTSQQLSKSYTTTTTKNKYCSFFTGIGMALLSFFSITSAEAQEVTKTENSLGDDSNTEALNNIANITVKGTVVTESDGLPLPGASVILHGTAHGVQTDFDGYFEFPVKLKKGDVLIVSYIGMESQKAVIENKKSASLIELKINMDETSCVLVGEVAVKKIFKSKKN